MQTWPPELGCVFAGFSPFLPHNSYKIFAKTSVPCRFLQATRQARWQKAQSQLLRPAPADRSQDGAEDQGHQVQEEEVPLQEAVEDPPQAAAAHSRAGAHRLVAGALPKAVEDLLQAEEGLLRVDEEPLLAGEGLPQAGEVLDQVLAALGMAQILQEAMLQGRLTQTAARSGPQNRMR